MGMERCYQGLVSYHIVFVSHKTGTTQRNRKRGGGAVNVPNDQSRNKTLVYWITFFDESFLYQMRKLLFAPKEY